MKCPKCNTDNPETVAFCADRSPELTLPKDVDVTEPAVYIKAPSGVNFGVSAKN